MKILTIVLTVLLAGMIQSAFAAEHIKESRSPLMSTSEPEGERKGVWIPHSYGGVTGLVFDLDEVGTDNMIRVRFNHGSEMKPFCGKNYRVHFDETIENPENNFTERTVILINESLLKADGSKEIVCYKILYRGARHTPSGLLSSAEETHYSLTFSRIKNDFEVLYLIPFRVSFPNADHPNSSKPPKKE